MSRPPRERVNAEQAFVDILTAPGAGVAAGVKRPPGFPNCAPFAVLFGNGGDRQTLVTETVTVEVESWARTKSAAWEQMNRITNTLEAASHTRGFRQITEERPPTSLETDFEGWYRYTTGYDAQQRMR